MRLFLFVFIFFSSSAFSTICPTINWDQTVRVKLINDGDTLTLENGRLVRFIGINTPEINYRNISKSEPYALKAKALVERYVTIGDKVHLFFDKDKQDKYGRILAYVYSKTGRDLAALQLQAGFAKQWVIGKNDYFWRCFQETERQARVNKKGLWADFTPLHAAKLTKKDRGYQYIKGEISKIIKNKKEMNIFLDNKLKIRLSLANVQKFISNNINFSVHDNLLLRGRVFFNGKSPQLTLYHPVQILSEK